MMHCRSCEGELEIARTHCPRCQVSHEGAFHPPRLARLDAEQQRLAEEIVLAAGNLKEVAGRLGISYPTLRKRVDVLVATLAGLRAADETSTRTMLDAVEAGRMTPEYAARRIRELNGG